MAIFMKKRKSHKLFYNSITGQIILSYSFEEMDGTVILSDMDRIETGMNVAFMGKRHIAGYKNAKLVFAEEISSKSPLNNINKDIEELLEKAAGIEDDEILPKKPTKKQINTASEFSDIDI